MSKPYIMLSPEITRANALDLMEWLEDESVTRYLSDSRHVSRFIEQVIGRVQLPTLTHLFNRDGRFFMAYDRHNVPVGFVRLVQTGSTCEIVLVIGNRDSWGRKLGASALGEGMKLAFFEMRAERLVAKIQAENTRSVNAFVRCGFALESETLTLKSFSITSEQYRRHLRKGTAGSRPAIYVTEFDESRLRSLLALEQNPDLFKLEHEIERAIVVDARQVAPNVITMNSKALLQLNDESIEVALVYPEDANGSARKLSICSGIGTAILGYREGDAIDWRISNRTSQIRIEKVLYQPEAAGDFHL
ncbi:GNAT family N-acetyltransferase [Alcaligenaceae bacterium A4P071]|nr:GNAT family N-acetyltransferase [Alcaligenaceae bacterium A4P071]